MRRKAQGVRAKAVKDKVPKNYRTIPPGSSTVRNGVGLTEADEVAGQVSGLGEIGNGP